MPPGARRTVFRAQLHLLADSWCRLTGLKNVLPALNLLNPI